MGRVAASDGRRTPVPPFERFLEEHRTAVYRFLMVTVGPSDADDCFQETFLAALRAYPRLDHGDDLRSWILTIATRKAIDAGRGRARRALPLGAGDDLDDPVGSITVTPTEELDTSDPLWGAVRMLPPSQRAAVVYRHVLDRSYDKIAELMGTTQETARANVSHGVRSLRAALEEEECKDAS
jgi:RNA polymerase sigma factor (sigma-70 family)